MQQLLHHDNSEGTRHLLVKEPFESRCYDGRGLVVDGCLHRRSDQLCNMEFFP